MEPTRFRSRLIPAVRLLKRPFIKDDYDTVYTITDWYDGPRAGVTDLNHQQHYYECHWDHTDDWSEEYLLNPIDEETFRLALEDPGIWRRWRSAFDAEKSH